MSVGETVRVTTETIRRIEAWAAQWDRLSQTEKHRWELRVAERVKRAQAQAISPVDLAPGIVYNASTEQ